MGKKQLIVCGSIAVDRIMNFTGRYQDLIQPDKLHVLSVSVLLDKLEVTRGGTGANIAYTMATLGEPAILLGAVGPDAKDYVEELTKAGVVTDFIHRSKTSTASFSVITDAEDNQIGGFYVGAMGDSASLTLEPWYDKDVVVCVSAHDPATMRTQVEACRQHDLPLLYDPGQQVSNVPVEDLKAGVAAATIIMVNDYERSLLCKLIGVSSEELARTVPLLVTTFGKDGSIIEGTNVKQPIKVACTTPAQVADPTGAGDAYRAGFLYGYLRQWDLRVCGQLGSVVASFVVEQHGTQCQFLTQDIIKRYQKTFNEEITL